MAASSSTSSIISLDASHHNMLTYLKVPFVYGRFTYSNGDPVLNQKIQISVKKVFSEKLETNSDGMFYFNCPKELRSKTVTLILDVIVNDPFDPLKKQTFAPFTIQIKKKLLKDSGTNLGAIHTNLFDYDPDMPDLKMDDEGLKRLWPYFGPLIKAGAVDTIKEFTASHVPLFNTEEVQEFFGKNPDLKLTPEHTIAMLLNGLYPCHFKKGPGVHEIFVDIIWDQYEKDARSPILPNAKLALNNDHGHLTGKSIFIQFPEKPWEEYAPDNPWALYLFNCVAIVKGELVSHLATHLRVGELAMAAYRSLRKNPIASLLLPHLKGVLGINRFGRSTIFGQEGILNVSGLTVNGIRQVLQDDLACFDYTTFQPRAPMNADHVFAQAGNRYWEILTDYVDIFFYNNKQLIEKHWVEIYYLSKNLVENSLPHKPEDGQMDPDVWVDTREIDDPSDKGRVKINGQYRALRPITESLSGPAEGDIDRLKQFCRYTIFKATWEHWEVHSSQNPYATNLQFASLAPEGTGKGAFGGTKLMNAIKQLSVAQILTKFHPEEGKLLENKYGDINPLLIEMLMHAKDEFLEKWGYDLGEMFYGIII